MRELYRKVREYIPLYAIVFFAIALISAIMHISFCISYKFAEFFNQYLTVPFRFCISKITSWIPFSIAEILILTSPVWAGVLLYLGIKIGKQGRKSRIKYICFLLCILCFIYITFVWTYSSGYKTRTVDERMGLENEPVSAEELYETAMWLCNSINDLSENIVYDIDGASKLEYSYVEMSKKLKTGYDNLKEEYHFIRNFRSNAKPIMMSEKMTYTHISGIYSYMTGEININTNYPDFIVASTVAHEMAHQRGIARENEANFIGFLACIYSEDDFLKYSGYMDIYDSIMSALYKASPELYRKVSSSLCSKAKNDKIAYAKFFEKYAESKASEVATTVNNAYLQVNGQSEGTKSYGMVVDLTVAFYNAHKAE